jgi:hypothetical protein
MREAGHWLAWLLAAGVVLAVCALVVLGVWVVMLPGHPGPSR